LYFAYGKALLEHAVTQTSVLGKQGAEGGDGDDDAEPGGHPSSETHSRFNLLNLSHMADVGGSTKGAFFSFSGDTAEDDGDDDDDEDGEDADDGAAPPDSDAPVDLFAEADKAVEAEDAAAAAAAEEEEGDDEPEDDFNAAWEILDLARVLFDQRKEESDEIKLKLADTHVALGDVSLETGQRFRLCAEAETCD
jgi:HAT1-interacting factor 1